MEEGCAAFSSDGACGRESPWKISQGEEEEACITTQPSVLRRALLAFQFASLLLCAVSLGLLYRVRNNAMINSVGWMNLETMLLGSIFIYFSVLYMHLLPNAWCGSALIDWVRFFGFLALYGPAVLHLCRLVVADSTGKWCTPAPGCYELAILASLSLLFWLSASVRKESPSIEVRQICNVQCPPGFINHIISGVELACLVWGLRVCHTVRKTTSPPRQAWNITAALVNEAACSFLFHMFWRLSAPALHPDWMILIAFMHEHLTVTANLGLLLIPKFVGVELLLPDTAVACRLERNNDVGPSAVTARVETKAAHVNYVQRAHLEYLKPPRALANGSVLSTSKNRHLRRGRTIFRRLTRCADGTLRSFTRESAVRERCSSTTSHIHTAPLLTSIKNPVMEAPKKEIEPCKRFSFLGSCVNTNHELPELNGEKLFSRSEKKCCNTGWFIPVPKDVPSRALQGSPPVCHTATSHSLSQEPSLSHYFKPIIKQKSLSLMDCAQEKASTDHKKASMDIGSRDIVLNYFEGQQRDTTSNQWKTSSLPKLNKSCWKKEHKYSFKNRTACEPVTSYELKQNSCRAVSNREEICPWEFQELPSSKSAMSKKTPVKKNLSIGSTKLSSLDGFQFAGKLFKAMRPKNAEGQPNSPGEAGGSKSWPTSEPQSGSSSPAGRRNLKPFGGEITAQMEETTPASGPMEASRLYTHDGAEHPIQDAETNNLLKLDTLQTRDTEFKKYCTSASKRSAETAMNADSSWKLPNTAFYLHEPHLEEMVEIFPWNLENVQAEINKNESPDWKHTETKVGIKLETGDTENKVPCSHDHVKEANLNERCAWEIDSDQELTNKLSHACKMECYDVTADCISKQRPLGWPVGSDGKHELVNNTDVYPSGVDLSLTGNAGASMSETMMANQSAFGNDPSEQAGSEISLRQQVDMHFGKKEIEDISLVSIKDNIQIHSEDVSSSEPMARVSPPSGHSSKTVTFRDPPALTPPCEKKKSDKCDVKCYGVTIRDFVSSGRKKR
ncbi:unnamed protein product [Lampetra fluviatilis]